MTRVVALWTGTPTQRSDVRALRERLDALPALAGLPTAISLSVVSWRRSDLPLTDLVAEHVVVAPGETTGPTWLREHEAPGTVPHPVPPAAGPEVALPGVDELGSEVPEGHAAEGHAAEGHAAEGHGATGHAPGGSAPAPTAPAPAAPPAARPPAPASSPLSLRRRLGELHWGTRRRLVRLGREYHPTVVRRRVVKRTAPVIAAASESLPARGARRVVRGGLARRFSRACWGSAQARRLLQTADVVVAMDVASIRVAWQLGHRRDEPVVAYGIDGAVREVRERAEGRVPAAG